MILHEHIGQIIREYSGELPLHHYLKQFFKAHPKLGSRDRRTISDAVYTYYRAAHFLPPETPVFSIIQTGLNVLNSQNSFLKRIIGQEVAESTKELSFNTALAGKDIALSQGIDEDEWLLAQMQQPDLFIRLVRNADGHLQRLKNKGIIYEPIEPIFHKTNSRALSLRLPNGSKIDQILPPEDYVVQDLSTQTAVWQAATYRNNSKQALQVWDVCAGAGGKTILWKELFSQDHILTTDIRKSILRNLKARALQYDLSGIKTLVFNAATDNLPVDVQQLFDIIICDVPCSGSGTWGRTPEQFYFFKKDDLEKFKALQWPIARNACRYLKPGGRLFYMTCSVFECENEAVVHQLQQEMSLKVLQQELINGISQKSDNIYSAVLQKG